MNKRHVYVNGIGISYEEYGREHGNDRPAMPAGVVGQATLSGKVPLSSGTADAHAAGGGRTGCGPGCAVILLHGFCGSAGYWRFVAPTLGESYRVIVPDLRGHGQSSVPDGTYTMETMADDIAALADALQVRKAVLFGHSLGGYVAAAFAERHPDRLAGLGLVHSTALPDTEEGKLGRLKSIEAIRGNGIHAFVRELIPKLFPLSFLRRHPEEVERIVQIGLQMNPDGAIRTLEGMRIRRDLTRVLAEAQVPLALIAGEEDKIVPPERLFSVTGAHVSQTTFENVAHMSLVEVPDQLTRVMAAYLQLLEEKEILTT